MDGRQPVFLYPFQKKRACSASSVQPSIQLSSPKAPLKSTFGTSLQTSINADGNETISNIFYYIKYITILLHKFDQANLLI
jgi:hypothetical protein